MANIDSLVAEMIAFRVKYPSLSIDQALKVFNIQAFRNLAKQTSRVANG